MVFYFTAARSSLYAAKQPDPEPVSVPQVFGRPGRPSAVCGARDGGRAGASAADSFRKPGAAGRAVERHLPGNRTLRRLRDLYKGVSCGCIHLAHGRAAYGAAASCRCQGCMACINACPQKAITMTIGEINPSSRYRNPHISLQEIMKANDQTGHASGQEKKIPDESGNSFNVSKVKKGM